MPKFSADDVSENTPAVVVLGLAIAPLAAQEPSTDPGRKIVHVIRTETPPEIDGDLGDAVWSGAAVVDDLHQMSPVEYAEPSEHTEIYVLYDDDALRQSQRRRRRPRQRLQLDILGTNDQGELHVLVSRPDAFAGYLIASPSIRENPAILDRAREAVRRGTRERVFVSVGALEDAFMVRDAERLALVLEDPAAGFVVRRQVLEGQEHVPSYLAALPLALPFLLPPMAEENVTEAVVDPETLQRYVGIYRVTGTGQVAITLEDGRLFAQLGGQPRLELVAVSDREFIARDEALRVSFDVDREGRVTGLILGASRYY